jgi:L-fucose isomerase
MTLARQVADLIKNNVKHSSGHSVEVVIADSTIGGVSEAAKCAEKFEREGVGVSLSVTRCWCYGSETMDMDPFTPKAVLGFNGTERPGAVYLAAVLAAHAQKGLPAFGVYGHNVQDADDESIPDDVAQKVLRFVRAGLAAASMRGASYLSMGSVAMGIAGSIVDPNFFQDYLGMRNESIDLSEFSRRMDKRIYDRDEFEKAIQWVRENLTEGSDVNDPSIRRSRSQKDGDWENCVKMALIAKDLMTGNPVLKDMGFGEESEGHNALLAGFQGQRQWTDYSTNGDFLETILNTSWDWNGIRQPYVVATENDALNGVAMLFGHLLTGAAQLFADVRTYWSPESIKRVTGYEPVGDAAGGLIHLINSGAAALDWTGRQADAAGKPTVKPWWEIDPSEAQACTDATQFRPADAGYFPGGGWSSDFTTRAGIPATMIRLNLIKGLGPVLQIAEGVTVELPEEIHKILDERTNPTWPTTWFAPRLTGSGPFKDVYSVMAAWGANHGVLAPGHVGADLITLASILRIPVDLHNVSGDEVFRPAAWDRFGALDPQGADYRACANYGALYK